MQPNGRIPPIIIPTYARTLFYWF